MYTSELVNRFDRSLFSANYSGYDTATQNAKTDYLLDSANFEDWLDSLISCFVKEVEDDIKFSRENDFRVPDPVDEDELRREIEKCPDFIEDMKVEYESLLDYYSYDSEFDNDDDDEESWFDD